jgi:hypothetical protein
LEGDGPTHIEAQPAPGAKCARCWLVKTDVDDFSQLCARCAEAIGTGK